MTTKYSILQKIIPIIACGWPLAGWAADITATLDSTDGASVFVVQESNTNTLLSVQSDRRQLWADFAAEKPEATIDDLPEAPGTPDLAASSRMAPTKPIPRKLWQPDGGAGKHLNQ